MALFVFKIQWILHARYPRILTTQQDPSERLKECTPLCALDFYVHESCQRSGYGKLLFETMLKVCMVCL